MMHSISFGPSARHYPSIKTALQKLPALLRPLLAVAILAVCGLGQAGWAWIPANAAPTSVSCQPFFDAASNTVSHYDSRYLGVSFNQSLQGMNWTRQLETQSFAVNSSGGSWSASQILSTVTYLTTAATTNPWVPQSVTFTYWPGGLHRMFRHPLSQEVQALVWEPFSQLSAHAWGLGGATSTPIGNPFTSLQLGLSSYWDFRVFTDAAAGSVLILTPLGSLLSWPGSGAVSVIQPLVVPPSVDFTNIVHDTARNRLVMLMLASSPPVIWEYDIALSMWFERVGVAPAAFTPRSGCSLGFHPPSGNVIIYGGAGGPNGLLGDVWHYDGVAMYQAIVGTTPARRMDARMVFRPSHGDMLMWGGSNGQPLRDTWSYVPGSSTVAFSYFGQGCQGGSGVPYLDLAPGALPYAGQRFSVMVKSLPFFAPTFMMVGASDVDHLGLQLPADLGVFGMPNCDLLTGPDGVYTCANVFGTALWDVQIPPGLGGQTFFNQAMVFDGAANPRGISLSNGGRAVVGF